MSKCARCNAKLPSASKKRFCAKCDAAATRDSSTVANLGATVELPVDSDAKTVLAEPPKKIVQATVDLGVSATNEIGGTIDLPAASKNIPGASVHVGTVNGSNAENNSGATVDLPASPPPKSRVDATVDLAGSATAAFDATVQPKPSPAGKTRSDDVERTIEVAWGSEPPEGCDLGSTIKGPSPTMTVSQTVDDLNIRAHRLRSQTDRVQSPAEFELQELIGEGGMGMVYAARQTSIDRTIALKMLRSQYAEKGDHRAKFLAEAVTTGELDHPNIVPIYDVGSTEDGALFYAMKRVRGTPWSKAMPNKSLSENLAILLSVADAVGFAHARGIVHRDLKPENVMLGDYGEVLVMDWGIALSQPDCAKANLISQTSTIGGTPIYMAPEMATGPLTAIGPQADVYLLGAILYEIVTGSPPHTGTTVMLCLRAAARNEIVPTEKKGELVDIALKAMSTKPRDRYPDVKSFQNAIRTYQSHNESVALATRAEEDLKQAERTRAYDDFARALFAFQESRALWKDNRTAEEGERRARIAYAQCALDQGDLDLGISLLDPDVAEQKGLHERLTGARREREARKGRLRNLRRTALSLAALVFLVVSASLYWINLQKEALATAFVTIQDRNEKLDIARKRADHEAEEARKAQQAEAYASYLAQIGTAAERIESNSFLDADRLLEKYSGDKGNLFRNWEWGHLRRLCRLDSDTIALEGRGEALVRSSDGNFAAAGTSRGELRVWRIDPAASSWSEIAAWKIPEAVTALALSADGVRLIVGTEAGTLRGFQRATESQKYTEERELEGHRSAVTGLALSPRGDLLASSGRDEAAKLWTFPELKEQRVLRGHFGPVHAVAFTSDGKQLVTGGDDGTARVWSTSDDSAPMVYRGHHQAVYAVAASSDGASFASAGRDREIHVWKPKGLREFDFAKLERDLESARTGDKSATPEEKHHEPQYRLRGHTGEIRTLSFASKGEAILSGGNDNTLRYWRFTQPADSPAFVTVLRGHGGWVRGAVSLGDGETAASVGHDERLKQWSLASYREVETLRGHDDEVLWSNFSAAGDRLVTASRDRRVLLWDAQGGTPLKELVDDPHAKARKSGPVADLREGHEFLLSAAAFFPADQNRLATAAGDNSVRIWDVSTGSQVRRLEGTGTVSVIAASPTGKRLLTGSETAAALLWNMREPSSEPLRLEGHKHEICAAAFSPSSDDLLATADIHGVCLLWRCDPATGIWSMTKRLEGHLPGYSISGLHFTPDGSRLAAASQDQTVMQWDTVTGLLLSDQTWKHSDGVKSFDLAADGSKGVTLCSVAAGGYRAYAWNVADRTHRVCDLNVEGIATCITLTSDGTAAWIAANSGETSTVWRWDLQSPVAERLWPEATLRGTVWSLVPSPDPRYLVAVGGNYARLLSTASGGLVTPYRPHSAVTSANFSPDGKTVVSTGVDGDVKFWNADDQAADFGKVRVKIARAHELEGRVLPVNFAAYSADGVRAATAGDDRTAKLWRVEEHAAHLLRTFAGHERRVLSVQISSDEKQLLTASSDGTARLWKLDGESPIEQASIVLKHPAPVLFAAFFPDGKRVVTGCADHAARVWEIARPERPLYELSGHTAGVTAAAVSPDATRLVTGSQDGIVKLWDLEVGNEVLSLKRHAAEITSAHFSRDGRNLLTGSSDHTALIWRAEDFGAKK